MFSLLRIQCLEHKLLSLVGKYRVVQRTAKEGTTAVPHHSLLPGRLGAKVSNGVALAVYIFELSISTCTSAVCPCRGAPPPTISNIIFI